MKKHCIYCLVSPRSNRVRYVGRSSSGLDRPRHHTSREGLAETNLKAQWVRKLLRHGLRPTIVVLEELPPGPRVHSLLNRRERAWVRLMRRQGHFLLNQDGGGCTRRGPRPQWIRDKIARAQLGKTLSPEHVAALKACRNPRNTGRRHTLRARLLMARHRGTPVRCHEHRITFTSMSAAARCHRTTVSNVSMALKQSRRCRGHNLRRTQRRTTP